MPPPYIFLEPLFCWPLDWNGAGDVEGRVWSIVTVDGCGKGWTRAAIVMSEGVSVDILVLKGPMQVG